MARFHFSLTSILLLCISRRCARCEWTGELCFLPATYPLVRRISTHAMTPAPLRHREPWAQSGKKDINRSGREVIVAWLRTKKNWRHPWCHTSSPVNWPWECCIRVYFVFWIEGGCHRFGGLIWCIIMTFGGDSISNTGWISFWCRCNNTIISNSTMTSEAIRRQLSAFIKGVGCVHPWVWRTGSVIFQGPLLIQY